MTQCPIVADLSLKGMSACEIHDDIVATLSPMLCHTVQLPAAFARDDFLLRNQNHPADVQRDLDDSDQTILAPLEDNPFASVQVSRLSDLPSTTVDRRLPHRWDLWRITFDGCHMLCQMRQRARESICPGDYCECSNARSPARSNMT
jgi:hypothetical protein